jgi:hypothetical protein
MKNSPGSQAPETEALLGENTATQAAGTSYQDDPELQQQHLNLDMGLASQSAPEDSTLQPNSPKDHNLMQISKHEGRKGDTLGLGMVAAGATVRPQRSDCLAAVAMIDSAFIASRCVDMVRDPGE